MNLINQKPALSVLLTIIIFSVTSVACASTTVDSERETTVASTISKAHRLAEDLDGPVNIRLSVERIRAIKGQLSVAMFNSDQSYAGAAPIAVASVAVVENVVTIDFPDLPAGQYAVKLFHDVDANGEMNTNLFGIPSEPFAFSNNATGNFGPAKWNDAAFSADSPDVSHTIQLH